MNKNLKAVCTHNDGNNFDPSVGEVVELNSIYITKIWRNGKEIFPDSDTQEYLHSILREGDHIEDNYCHGQYKVINPLMKKRFHVQETIGGWRQVSCFEGTYEECQEYVTERCHNGSFAIVPEWDYEVDYL